MKRIGLVGLICLWTAGCGSVSVPTNDAVHWDGTYAGLMPMIQGSQAEKIRAMKTDATGPLLRALKDPDRYITAHVLLTEIYSVSFRDMASNWNGLFVGLKPDGSVVIDPSNQQRLIEQWQAFFARREGYKSD